MTTIGNQTDELLADSMQLKVCLNHHEQKIIVEEDIRAEVESYLERYKKASGRLQLQIFALSGLYLWKLERYLQLYH